MATNDKNEKRIKEQLNIKQPQSLYCKHNGKKACSTCLSDISGSVSGIKGDVSDIYGSVSGIKGDVSNIIRILKEGD